MAALTATPDLENAPALLTGATSAANAGRTSKISGPRKVAIYLTAVGDKLSAEVLRSLNDAEIYEVTRELSILGDVTEQERNEVLHEFLRVSDQAAFFSPGGIKYATSVLINAFGPENGKRMAERLMKAMGNDTAMIDKLRKADPQLLAKLVRSEHPQTIALILCHLAASQAATLLSALPEELQTEVARRMAALDQISPDTINKLAKTVWGKLRVVGDFGLEACGGTRAVAEILNHVEAGAGDNILNSITEQDPSLAENIRQLMFVFEDLLRLGPDVLRTIVGKVDRQTLVLALKGSSPKLKAAFMGIMSSRAAEILNEDLEALGPVRLRDVQTAQQAIITQARELQKQGLFSLNTSPLDQLVE
jgi:flagellar motor switch protein FliG